MIDVTGNAPNSDLPALIAMDMDGTVAGLDHAPSAYTEEVLRKLTPLGIKGVIITGRSERSTLGTARSTGLTGPVVSANGAIVTEPATGERLWLKHIDPDAARHAAAVAVRLGTNPMIWTPDAWFIEHEDENTATLTDILEQTPQFAAPEDVIANHPVVKIMLGGDPQLLDEVGPELEAEVPGMTRSMDQYYETAPPQATKAEALQFILERLGIGLDQVWGFADGGNDVGWLSLVRGRRLAMANARPEVKAVASEIIGHHADDGVAKYLVEHLGL